MADESVNADVKSESTETDNANQVIDYTDDTAEKGGNMIPKSRFDQVLEQRKRATDALRTVADEMVEDVPEQYQSIIPDLEPAAKITWIRNAIKTGLFNKTVVNGLDSKRPSGKPVVDLSNVSIDEKFKAGYKT